MARNSFVISPRATVVILPLEISSNVALLYISGAEASNCDNPTVWRNSERLRPFYCTLRAVIYFLVLRILWLVHWPVLSSVRHGNGTTIFLLVSNANKESEFNS